MRKSRTWGVTLSGFDYVSEDRGATNYTGAGGPRVLSVPVNSGQEIETFNHPGFFNQGGGDQGGPFESFRREIAYDASHRQGDRRIGDFVFGYEGDIAGTWAYPGNQFPLSAFGWSDALSADSAVELFALGGTAISRTLPTNPVGDAATFLGELREGLPHLIGESLVRPTAKRALKAQKAGHEYLNVEFGWKPLISDIRKFANGVKKHDQIVSQLSRDSGRNVRRRYEFPEQQTSYNVQWNDNWALGTAEGGAFVTYLYAGPGTHYETFESSKKTWFSGCYTYHLPDYNEVFGVKRFLAEADKLYGVKLTPEVLWNLAPWSWAADWFANTGDVLNNLSQFSQNDIAMRYGYIMQEVKTSVRVTSVQPLKEWSGRVVEHHSTRTYTYTSKVRYPASPFGFGLAFSDFTPRQLAITAALGLSRAR